tara:strand:- start:1908 stop:2771 length:864 start_codon:yes stop_codon:yes gene_type:complete
MIFINRNKVKKPDVLKHGADDEHNEAHKHYVTDAYTKAFDHKLFKNIEVKKALETLFNGKCAYCESDVITTSAIDKEHFRPKTSIKDRTSKKSIRGYYWLAADWDNLLLACAHCNRTGTHETINDEEFVSGKLDYFPISNESKRAIYGADLTEEDKVRLLLNPCKENPETLIKYNSDGEILPLNGLKKMEEEMVETSVMIFGLNRSTLHKKRREKWKTVQLQIERIKDAYEDYLETSNKKYLERLIVEFSELKECKTSDKEYLGVSRFVIRQELSELRKILIAIKNI